MKNNTRIQLFKVIYFPMILSILLASFLPLVFLTLYNNYHLELLILQLLWSVIISSSFYYLKSKNIVLQIWYEIILESYKLTVVVLSVISTIIILVSIV
jgi:hypothetical protein